MRALCAILGALILAGCQQAPADDSADLKAIGGLRDAYVAAFNAEDAEKTAALYATDGILLEDRMPLVSGRDAIRGHYAKIIDGMDTDIQLKAEETVVNGDWAFDRGQAWVHIMSKDPKSNLPMIMDQGKYLVILKRHADNSWQLARVISNSSIGPPPAK